MRALPARRIATSALCATFLLGIAGPVAVAADHDATRDARATAAVLAPVPEADALLAQATSLGDVAGVLKPVTDLLTTALKADGGKLPAADATKLGDAVKEAIAKATASAPAAPQTPPAKTPAVPQTPAEPKAPTVPQTPAEPKKPEVNSPADPEIPAAPPAILPALPGAPALPAPGVAGRVAAPDLRADALKALQSSVDTLVQAAVAGDATALGAAAKKTVSGLVNFVAAVAVGGALPAPNLPGLPKPPTNVAAQSGSGG
ncbi:hypothetical protein C6Y14_09880 [Streptomyces dioscori]|uniref:Meckel syndrome type 1 protein n=1 Tax=Streptomyces dioscori TaxID=2109333 RepID=A0A2P8QB34_9ACTN|nr:hypothetical protein [Streptomyces dioscori]PSM43424.1 hypothetical protein C6Y14_09880 [Streptomyces dioscori]